MVDTTQEPSLKRLWAIKKLDLEDEIETLKRKAKACYTLADRLEMLERVKEVQEELRQHKLNYYQLTENAEIVKEIDHV